MIISHKYKFIYIRPVKVASQSTELKLHHFIEPNDIFTDVGKNDSITYEKAIKGQKIGIASHASYKIIASKWPKLVDQYFTFSAHRNTYERYHSHFFWKSPKTTQKQIDVLLNSNIETQRRLFIKWMHSKESNSTILSNWLSYTLNDKIACDYVIDYKNYNEELIKVGNIIGIDIKLTERYNKGILNRPSIKEFYTDELIKLVYNLNKTEIDHWKYAL